VMPEFDPKLNLRVSGNDITIALLKVLSHILQAKRFTGAFCKGYPP
jgi:hypothetical protein